jgi:AcrR family transcriptional regulator
MGIKERREREKGEMREAILRVAREIAIAEGWSSVSIRKIADRIEYSPPMIYEYFANKEHLLLALLTEGYRQLLPRLRAARGAAPTPERALVAMGVAYWEFARENPELYRVMNGLDGVSFGPMEQADKPPELNAVVEEVMVAIMAWSVAAGVTIHAPLDVFFIMWGALHGLVSLDLSNMVKAGVSHPRDLIAHSVRTIVEGTRALS